MDKADFPYMEEVLKKPWLQMYLRELSRTSVRLMAGELIDPILDWVRTKSDFARCPSERSEGSSAALRRWSASYRLYDRMTRILETPLPKQLGTGDLIRG